MIQRLGCWKDWLAVKSYTFEQNKLNNCSANVCGLLSALFLGEFPLWFSSSLLLLGAVPIILLFFFKPIILFYIFLFASVWWLPIVNLGDLTVSMVDFVLFSIVIVATIFGVVKKYRKPIVEYRYNIAAAKKAASIMILIILAGIIGSLASFYSGGLRAFIDSLLIYMKRWGEFSVLPLSAIILIKKHQVKALWTVMVIIGVALVASSLILPGYLGRATSIVFNPNVFGLICVIVFSAGISYMATMRSEALGIIAIFAGFFGVIVSGSRSSGFALLVVLIYWIFHFRRSIFVWLRARHILSIAILVVVALIGSSYSLEYASRWRSFITGQAKISIAFRIDAWKVAASMAIDRPFLGYGIGNVQEYATRYVGQNANVIWGTLSTTDNQYLDILLEAGVLGLILSFWVIFRLWKASAPTLQIVSGNKLSAQILHVFRSVLIGFLIAGFGVPSFSSPFTSSWMFNILALGIVARTNSGATISEKEKEHGL